MTSMIPFNHGNGLNAPNVGGSQVTSCFQEKICPRLSMADVVGISMRLSNATTTITSAGLNKARNIGISFLTEDELSRLSECIWGSINYPKKIFSTSNDPNACDAKSKLINIRDLVKYFYDFILSAIDLDIRNSRTELDPNSLINTFFPKAQRETQDQIKTPDWNCINYLGHQRSVLDKCEGREKDCLRNLGQANGYRSLWIECEKEKTNCTQDLQNANVYKSWFNQCGTEKTECETKKTQCEAEKTQSDPNWSDLCEGAKGDCERKLNTESQKVTNYWNGWDQCNKDKAKCETDKGNCNSTLETEIGKATTNWRGWDQCNKEKAKCETDKGNCNSTLETEIGKATTNWRGWDQCNKEKAKCETDKGNCNSTLETEIGKATTNWRGWDQCNKEKAKCERSKNDYRGKLEEALRNATIYRNDRDGWDQCKRDKARALGAFKTANETANSYKSQWDACLLTEKTLRAEIDEQVQSINRYKKALESESMSIVGFNLSKNIFWHGVNGLACMVFGFLFGLIASGCGKNRPKGREELDETQEAKLETTQSVMIENFSRPSNRWGSSNTSDELRKLREFRTNQEVLEKVDKKLAEEVELLSRNWKV